MQTIQKEGPVLPTKIAQVLGTTVLLASAQLSELVSRKKLLISQLKVGGGSPVYYLPGQEEKLQNFYDNLDGKDKQTFDLLKEKKILRDKELEPMTRVSIRGIKDFAKALEVNIGGQKEIFWKWYLIKNEEASELIREKLQPKIESPKPNPAAEEEKKIEEEKPVEKEQESKEEKPEPKQEEKKEEKEEKQQSLETEKEEKKNISKKKEIQSDFAEKVKDYLDSKKIKILEQEIIRKTEINLVLGVQTSIGEILYFGKAKGKKKCNDKDVSAAFLEGQIKKLPVAFLYNGEITKKAEEMVKQDIFKNLLLLQMTDGD